MPTKLDRATLGIILYLVSRLNGVLGKTHLQKLLFLADLLSNSRYRQPITALEYKRYKHGPYAQSVNEYASDLIGRGLIEAREFPLSDGSGNYTRYYLKNQTPLKKEVLAELIGHEKLMVVDEVVESFGNMSLQSLLNLVYSLEIVKEAKANSILDLAKSTSAEKDTIDEGDKEELPF